MRSFQVFVAACLAVLLCGAASAGPYRHYILTNTGGTCVSTGNSTIATSSASPPAIQTGTGNGLLTDMTANTCLVGVNGIYGAAAISSLVQRGSLETWAAGAPSGWTEATTSTGDCAEETTNIAHGTSGAACTLADADDAVTLTSACLTVSGSTAYYVSAWAKLGSGTGLLDINILEDDSADCGSITNTTAVVDDAVPTSSWEKQGGTITTQAGTIRLQVQISLPAAAAQVLYVDAIQLRAGSVSTDALCATDADATAVCSAVIYSIPSPISANGTFQIEFVSQSPWAGTDLGANTYLIQDGAASGANTIQIHIANGTDEPVVRVYDAGNDAKYVGPNASNWAANTAYTVRASKTATGSLRLYWNSAWQTTEAGTGTGLRGARQSDMNLCNNNGTAGSDCWIQQLKFYRRLRQ